MKIYLQFMIYCVIFGRSFFVNISILEQKNVTNDNLKPHSLSLMYCYVNTSETLKVITPQLYESVLAAP